MFSVLSLLLVEKVKKVKVCYYIAQYPVRWTTHIALHFYFPDRPVHSDTNSASLESILVNCYLNMSTYIYTAMGVMLKFAVPSGGFDH